MTRVPLRDRRRRRPAERRQVHARERAGRPEDRDRVGQAADHAPAHPRDPQHRRRAGRVHRHAGLPQAVARSSARGSTTWYATRSRAWTPSCWSSTRRRASVAATRTCTRSRSQAATALKVCVVNKIDGLHHHNLVPQLAAVQELGEFDEIVPVSAQRRRGRRRAARPAPGTHAGGPAAVPVGRGHRRAARDHAGRAGSRAGAARDAAGGAALDRRGGRRDRARGRPDEDPRVARRGARLAEGHRDRPRRRDA